MADSDVYYTTDGSAVGSANNIMHKNTHSAEAINSIHSTSSVLDAASASRVQQHNPLRDVPSSQSNRQSITTSSGHDPNIINAAASNRGSVYDMGGTNTLICWLYPPFERWNLQYYWTLRGAENFHIYLWTTKDLCWMQLWYYPGMLFGALAVTWSMYLLVFHAFRDKNLLEIYLGVGQFLWLFANYWWMTGELHDAKFPNEPPWYDDRRETCGVILKVALVYVGIFTVFLKPLGIIKKPIGESGIKYDRRELTSRFQYLFPTWRDYENIHIFFWLGKDTAWNALIPSMWVIFVIPTILVALDFSFTSFFNKFTLIDHAHYVSVFLWVIGNFTWALGELFYPEYDNAYPLSGSTNSDYLLTARWWSSWIMVSSYIPIAMVYTIWAYYTFLPIGVIYRPQDLEIRNSYFSTGKSRPVDLLTVEKKRPHVDSL